MWEILGSDYVICQVECFRIKNSSVIFDPDLLDCYVQRIQIQYFASRLGTSDFATEDEGFHILYGTDLKVLYLVNES